MICRREARKESLGPPRSAVSSCFTEQTNTSCLRPLFSAASCQGPGDSLQRFLFKGEERWEVQSGEELSKRWCPCPQRFRGLILPHLFTLRLQGASSPRSNQHQSQPQQPEAAFRGPLPHWVLPPLPQEREDTAWVTQSCRRDLPILFVCLAHGEPQSPGEGWGCWCIKMIKSAARLHTEHCLLAAIRLPRLPAQRTPSCDLPAEEDAEELRCAMGLTAAGCCPGGTAACIHSLKLDHSGGGEAAFLSSPAAKASPFFQQHKANCSLNPPC